MTALEFMEKQVRKCQINFEKESGRGAPAEVIGNLLRKIGYYQDAVEALRRAGNG